MSTPDAAAIGQALRSLRKRAGLTQAAFAGSCGWNQSYVSRMESGQFMPGMAALLRAGEALGRTLDEIIDTARTIQAAR